MTFPPKAVAVLLVAAAATITVSPVSAGNPAPRAGKETSVIYVVIDHENQLALVPEGTVIPAGLKIYSTQGDSADQAEIQGNLVKEARPLVFSYAPADRFRAVRAHSVGDFVPEYVGYLEAVGKAGSQPTTVSPCPTQVVVELTPDSIHDVTCSYFLYNGHWSEQITTILTFPTTIRQASQSVRFYNPNGPFQDFIAYAQGCAPPATRCGTAAGTGFPSMYRTVDSRAFVRMPGACTQDPPFCPSYYSTVTFAIQAP
jgi:hypothetical protein